MIGKLYFEDSKGNLEFVASFVSENEVGQKILEYLKCDEIPYLRFWEGSDSSIIYDYGSWGTYFKLLPINKGEY